MTAPFRDYGEACARAATLQGLDPFVQAGREAGLDVQVWQTGGFTMVAAVPGEPMFTVTYEGGWILVRADDEESWSEWDEDRITILLDGTETWPVEHVVDLIKAG